MKKIKSIFKKLTYPKIIALGFMILILFGTVLLMLPVSSRDGNSVPFMNALFVATSASCVTGLTVYDTYEQWSLFGQIVIITLIQIGGLGFLTIITMFSMLFRRRIGLKERTLLQESVNTMYVGGIVKLTRKILFGTAIIELTGAALLSIRFIPEMGVPEGIYNALFTSISAFCNAGFDLMGRYEPYCSLTHFYDDTLVVITISLLINFGAIGFFVWDDISVNKLNFRKYKLHTKLVLIITAALIVFGTAFFWIAENDNLLKGMSIKEKFLISLFGAVTPRTAGFNTVETGDMTTASKLFTIIYMFIGGSPGSTAGGSKTTTIAVIMICVWANLRNSPNPSIFNRRLEDDILRKASSVVFVNFTLAITGAVLISIVQSNIALDDIIFEVFSAIDTVGMTTGITRDLNNFSRLVITLLMYCGRVGTLSFALLFTEQKKTNSIVHPVEKINIG
ncbi:MAG: TrkH family potassium uptake protein [Oscillospiraceae bacterium]